MALLEMTEEFGCEVKADAHVPAGIGWLSLDGAVVRGEHLVAVTIHELRPNGIPFFQVEYLLELCGTLTFERFRGCVLYIAVVSNEPDDVDEDVRSRLEAMTESALVEAHIRMYRLNPLRAKHRL